LDRYFGGKLVPADPVLEDALAASDAANLPAFAVSPLQGKLLQVLAQLHGARTILELGTLGGYSTIWLARALPAGGRLTTLELVPAHAAVARENFLRAGLADRIELRVGPALQSMEQLLAEGREPFDFIFIDADKEAIPEYFAAALKLSRRGTAILVDNVVRQGAVADAASPDAGVRGVRRLMDVLAADPRVNATTIQTVGVKGHDGFTLAVVVA
jgi:predicted O-methyltransferase YrrM